MKTYNNPIETLLNLSKTQIKPYCNPLKTALKPYRIKSPSKTSRFNARLTPGVRVTDPSETCEGATWRRRCTPIKTRLKPYQKL